VEKEEDKVERKKTDPSADSKRRSILIDQFQNKSSLAGKLPAVIFFIFNLELIPKHKLRPKMSDLDNYKFFN
jgi:hypothetical protein